MANTDIKGVSEDTPAVRLFEVLKDDIMVSLSEGVYKDPRTGRDYEMTRSEVAHEGDQYDNLSLVLIGKIDAGELAEVFKEVDESERVVAPAPAPTSNDSDELEIRVDTKTAAPDEMSAEIDRLEKAGATITVIGKGKDGNVLKQDLQKALDDYAASRPGA